MINGAKQFITNAGTDISGHVAITARTGDDEISNLIVENGTPGYEQGEPYRKMGWNASDTRPLTSTDCRVPEENLLGPARAGLQAVPAHPRHRPHRRGGDGRRAGAGRARPGAGLREGAAAFGKPISKFQAIQVKLADMATEIEAARLLDVQGGAAEGRGPQLHADRGAGEAQDRPAGRARAEEAVQIHGGYGYIEEYPVCRFYRDAKILTIGEGTDEVQQMVIARALGA